MFKEAYNYSIFLLSKRDYSIYKMEQKLSSRKYDCEIIKDVINKLLELNYLREEEYKNSKIKSLLIKGYSNSFIIKKLEIEKLEATNEQIDQIRNNQSITSQDSLDYLVQKKLRGKVIPDNFDDKMKLKRKILNFLASKGYSYQEAKDSIDKNFKN